MKKIKIQTALVSVSDKSRLNELSDYFLKIILKLYQVEVRSKIKNN